MIDDLQDKIDLAAHNLLINCAGCEPGDLILIVHETEDDDDYDNPLTREVESAARRLGFIPKTHGVPWERNVSGPDAELCTKMTKVDPTICLDGVPVWENGRLVPDRVANGSEFLRGFPDMTEAFVEPKRNIRLGRDGRLRPK